MRVVLASMNDIGKHALAELVKFVDVVGLFTVKERGTLYMDPSDFTGLTRKHHIPLHKITDINAPDVEAIMKGLQPDLGMCLGWKQIIKKNILGIPRYGWIGGHPAKLLLEGETPDPRVLSAPGNEPLQYAIRGGYEKTGMSLQWLRTDIDAGELFARGEVSIDPHETSATLVKKIGALTAQLIRDNMQSILDGNPPRMPQEHKNKQPYTKPLLADDNRIDPSAPIEETYRLIRSEYYPYPNAFLDFYGTQLYVTHARMEDGAFVELRVRIGGTPYDRPATEP